MKSALIISVLILVMMSGMAAADIETGWPMDKPNEYNGTHVMIDFEDGICGNIVTSTNMVMFDNEGLYPWIYGCKYCGLTIYPHGSYIVNGNCGAWCNITGDFGNISFKHDVEHVSILASINTHLYLDAYNSAGELIASANTTKNWNTMNFTRLSVDRPVDCDISYVRIHDSGNYWLIDDLIVGYEPVCTEIVISTNGSDDTVCFGMTINFTADCTDQYGFDMECPGLDWESSDNRVGTMDGSVFIADKKGNTTIYASYDGVTSNLIDITVVPGQKMLAHCQKFIHSNGKDHWNESAYMNKTHPCNYTV